MQLYWIKAVNFVDFCFCMIINHFAVTVGLPCSFGFDRI